MVGVAGKSKGCHTCRKRKIKCDLSRPTCGQCARGSWKCEGYKKPVVFLNEYSTTYQASSTRSPIASQDAGIKGLSVTQNNQQLLSSEQAVRSREEKLNLQLFSHAVNTAQYDQILASFVTFCLPTQTSEEVPLAWLSSLAREPKKSRALLLSSASLGYGWMGHVENRVDVSNNGRRFYSQALGRLRSTLSQPALISDLLPTILMLLLYEIFEYGTQSSAGWISHTEGIETVLRLRGSHPFTDSLEFQMFHFYRTVGILKGLTTRKSCFLSNTEWAYTWFPGHTKNRFDELLDLAVIAPGLLDQADNIPAHDTETQSALVLRISTLIHQLKIWEESKNVRLPQGPPHAFISSSASMMVTDQMQPRVHRYPSKHPQSLGIAFDELQSARWLLFEWAIALMLYTALYSKPSLSDCLKDESILGFLSCAYIKLTVQEADLLTEKIMMWADFCSQNAWQSFGPAIAIISIKAAIQWYKLRQRTQLANLLPIDAQHQLKKCHSMLNHMTYCDRFS
ncbi:uncharacterized protein TRUGW13939_04630 [Talaromyces rugulosus]|uniref:Zn(2)-C6 fungal-type domain-containing protein n=1 Tax=Talaromyces rugulosus TaxID=121627 RepID=A0A7H8QUQ2_TALRU|nr:uncharacterized protein TRUGW13939_04630 [Talaromyces rugulosus]QKX57516.1 hypothetical protein TRUGW13939_04630 [Talaromyces rugulosus]